MDNPVITAQLMDDGVTFSVRADGETRDCFIERETLLMLAKLKGFDATDADTLDMFQAFEQTIGGAALRRIAEQGKEAPLVLRLNHFHASGTSASS
jgi:hypothetical protein